MHSFALILLIYGIEQLVAYHITRCSHIPRNITDVELKTIIYYHYTDFQNNQDQYAAIIYTEEINPKPVLMQW